MTTYKKISLALLSVLLVIISFLSAFMLTEVVSAEELDSYSFVIDDLSKDESFDENNYPYKKDDYSVQLMQIAESIDKKLLVYIYQPSGEVKNLVASSINISTENNDDINFRNYKLRLINSSGTLYKYIVEDFTVSTVSTRYYVISTLYRYFDESIDEQAEHGNEVTEVDYEVAKQYCFSTLNGKSYVDVAEIETIEITDKFVGFVRYSNGFELFPGTKNVDSHFVAFNTDRKIDKLMEADVYYTSQSYSRVFAAGNGETIEFGNRKDDYAYLKHDDHVNHHGNGWFAPVYEWDRIETVDQFIEENDLTQNVYAGALLDVSVANEITDEDKKALKGKKWLLRFVETPYTLWSGVGSTHTTSTIVGNVSILRLKFETDGIVYNLGTIDNKQNGSDEPINKEDYIFEASDLLKLILAIIALILILVFLGPILPYIIKAVLWIVMLPFRLLKSVVKAIKKKSSADNGTKVSNKNKKYKGFSDKSNLDVKPIDIAETKHYKRDVL